MTRRGAVRVIVSVVMLALAWRLADGQEMLAILHRAQWSWLILAVSLTVPMQVLSALRWCFTCQRLGIPLTLRQAVAEYYLASLMNMTLPGGVTGDAARIWRQGQDVNDLRRAAHGVLLERGSGQAALVLVMLAGVAAHPGLLEPLTHSPWLLALLAVVPVLAVIAALAIRQWPALRALASDARRAWWPGRILMVQVLLSLAVVTSYLAIFAATAAALDQALPAATALLAIPLVLTAMALPISVGGTGPRELGAAALWPLLGMDAAAGAATALAYGLVVLSGSLPGAVVAGRSPGR